MRAAIFGRKSGAANKKSYNSSIFELFLLNECLEITLKAYDVGE